MTETHSNLECTNPRPISWQGMMKSDGDTTTVERISTTSATHATATDSSSQIQLEEKSKTKVAEPSFYRVHLLNDDYTPMDFVVGVLQKFFHKTHEEATHIMLQVHHQGRGLAGVFTREVAETKVHQVNIYARRHLYPLQCSMERD